ncbi:hypothetical protein ACFL3S_01610 [Gemmatimonadota bacterium]
MTRKIMILVCGSLTLAFGGPVQAQSPVDRVAQFARAAPELAQVPETIEGSLRPGEAADIPVDLAGGSHYTVVAFCEAACSDLDLVLLNPDGEGVETDIFPDAEPTLSFTAGSTGSHTIRTVMVACSREPCRFALGLFQGSFQEGRGVPRVRMAERMIRLAEELSGNGYQELPMEQAGFLDQAHELRFPVTLEAGVEYQIVGVCDDDCSDLDLALFDPWEGEMAADRFADATPILSVSTERPAVFRVGVTMVECQANPCEFQVGFFGKGGRIGPGGVLLPGRVLSTNTLEGVLEEGDERPEGGALWDAYSAEAEAGQLLVVDLQSSEFDTFLILQTPEGEQSRRDEIPDDRRHSHLLLEAPVSGTYTIFVTSHDPEAAGSYTLQVAVAEGPGVGPQK